MSFNILRLTIAGMSPFLRWLHEYCCLVLQLQQSVSYMNLSKTIVSIVDKAYSCSILAVSYFLNIFEKLLTLTSFMSFSFTRQLKATTAPRWIRG